MTQPKDIEGLEAALASLKEERGSSSVSLRAAPDGANETPSQSEGDREPACDITGRCEPFDDEADQEWTMCQHCGGQRKRDYPTPGNWGIPPSGEA